MRKIAWLSSIAMALIAAIPAPVPAQEITGISVQTVFLPTNWSNDVAPAHYAHLERTIPCSINTISTTVVMSRINPDPARRFHPTARLAVSTQSSNGPDRQSAVLEISSEGENQKIPRVHFSRLRGTETLDRLDLGSIPIGEKADLELSWDGDGEIAASLNGGERLLMPLGTRPHTLLLAISGASASFNNIETGFQGSLPPDCGETAAP